jgi:hypothetical protein
MLNILDIVQETIIELLTRINEIRRLVCPAHYTSHSQTKLSPSLTYNITVDLWAGPSLSLHVGFDGEAADIKLDYTVSAYIPR